MSGEAIGLKGDNDAMVSHECQSACGLGQRGSRAPSGGDPSRGDASVMDTRPVWALVALTAALSGHDTLRHLGKHEGQRQDDTTCKRIASAALSEATSALSQQGVGLGLDAAADRPCRDHVHRARDNRHIAAGFATAPTVTKPAPR